MAEANSGAAAGDTVNVAAGTYTTGIDPQNDGTSADWIVFRASTGAKPVISGANPAIELSARDYVCVTSTDKALDGDGFQLNN
jgi:hypothetical protein